MITLIWNLYVIAVAVILLLVIKFCYSPFALLTFIPMMMIVIGGILVDKIAKSDMPKDNSLQYFINLGYKTGGSMRSQATWEFANTYFGKLYLRLSGVAGLLGIWLLLIWRDTPEYCLFPQLIFVVLPIFLTEREIDKQFDRAGNRK